MKTVLVTGGLGFIGSHFVRLLLGERADVRVTVLDSYTYAANPANLSDVCDDPRLSIVRGDICQAADVREATGAGVDAIVNFAAETHVDRAILDPEAFLRTNVLGTHVILEAVRDGLAKRLVHVSTDEVYGEVAGGTTPEDAPLAPRSPYAASKAAADLMVLAAHTTYELPVLITRGSNTYGPNQYPEKVVPLFITNLLEGAPLPLYGDGLHQRDWIHVEDHAAGIARVLEYGKTGEVYNIGCGEPRTNLELTRAIVQLCGGDFERDVRHVADRPGHDRRYCVDASRIRALGWSPRYDFTAGLRATVAWYRDHPEWWKPLKSGDFKEYYRLQYAERLLT
jgi:dTDP-glucose 4,6-dehydratase